MKLLYLPIFIIIMGCPKGVWAGALRVGNIVLAGNKALSSEKLRGLMGTQVGQPYSEELLSRDFERIVELYEENGYRFARIEEENLSIKTIDSEVYLRIHVDEGIIGKITVSGNRRTKDYVIIRQLLFDVASVYTWEDELESERILRRKSYLGSAEILATRDPETKLVWIQVEVTDLWTFFPALDLPAFSNSNSGFLVSLSDSNVFGTGHDAGIRYQLINEADEDPRSRVSSNLTLNRLFESYWNLAGTYTQKREGDSWSMRLQRPLYSLQTRWSADFTASESVDEIRWYEGGRKTDTFERRADFQSGRVVRSFGDRHRQTQVALWGTSQRSNFTRIQSLAPSAANFQDRNIRMVGVAAGYRRVDFVRTRFLDRMGVVEDVGVGYGYSASIGYASPLYGSDRVQTSASLSANLLQAIADRFFVNADASLTRRFATQDLDRSVFSANFKVIATDLLHQTFAAQISTVLGFDLDGESQVILGGENGLRGYSTREFSGEKMIRLNIESRKIFWEHSLVVVGSAVFADVGYIWNGEGLDLGDPKRSVGFGLRAGLPKLGGSRVYRLDVAYPLDGAEVSLLKPVFSYAIGHVF